MYVRRTRTGLERAGRTAYRGTSSHAAWGDNQRTVTRQVTGSLTVIGGWRVVVAGLPY